MTAVDHNSFHAGEDLAQIHGSSDEADEAKKPIRRKKELSHLGMAKRSDTLTIADQETLALRLLSQRHT